MYLFRSARLNWLLAGFFVVFACILAFYADSATAANKGIQVKAKTPDGGSEQIDLYRGSHALLIGVSNYTGGWPKLESVPAELASIESALKLKGFTVDKYIDPTRDQMFRAFEGFINSYGYIRENRLLFYFSGHGHTFQDGRKGYLVPADAPNPEKDKVGFLQKALGMNQVLAWARDIEAKHALFLFDSCFSGTIFKQRDLPAKPSHISRATALPVRQFITAGSAGEPVPAASTFTPAIVDALKFKWGDLNNDGYVSATELGLYLQEEVPKHVAQHPQYGKIPDYELSRGDFIFLVGGIIVTQEPTPQRPKSGSMKIRSQPTGASVYINEKYRGKAPVSLKDLSPGTFSVRVKLDGYQDQEKTISVRSERTASVQFFLDEVVKKGRLYVTTEPEDARVKILNITPQYHEGIELEAGRYHIEVSKDGYETERQWVELSAGEDLDVQIRLKPKAISAAKPIYASYKDQLLAKLGLVVQDLTEELAEKFGYRESQGVLVAEVEQGSPAARVGIRPGHLIEEVNRKRVHNMDKFVKALAQSKQTKSVLFRIRDGEFSRYVAIRIKKGRLYVTTEPEDARVKILNITSQYYEGIELKAGRLLDRSIRLLCRELQKRP